MGAGKGPSHLPPKRLTGPWEAFGKGGRCAGGSEGPENSEKFLRGPGRAVKGPGRPLGGQALGGLLPKPTFVLCV